jgi:hypothetical protein
MLKKRVVRRVVRMATGALILHAVLIAVATAQAQARPPEGAAADAPQLQWRAPPGCPEREVVLAQVEVLVARDDVSWARFAQISGAIEHTAGRWSLALEFGDSGGVRRRVMYGADCKELGDAAAVAIVLALRSSEQEAADWPAGITRDQGQTASAARAEPAEGMSSGASEVHTEAERNAGSPREVSELGLTTAIELEGLLDPYTLGSAALGGALGAKLRFGRYALGLYVLGLPAVALRLSASESLSIGLWSGGLRACREWGRGVDTCALLELGELRSEGVGLSEAAEARNLWAAPGASLGFSATPFKGFGITTRVAALHPLVRGSFRVDESEIVHRIPLLGFRAALGIDVPLQ